jgi:hypothetical protein
LRNDVERLLLYALGQPKISLEDVRQIVGPMALQDDWAMTNAIESGEAAGALRQLALMLDAGAPPEKVLGQLGWLVRTKFPAMSPGGFPRAVEALFRTDQDLKQSGGEPRVLLERLVVELCASRRQRGADRLCGLRAVGEAGRDAGLVAGGRVAMNDALACHAIDQRDGLTERRLRACEVLPVDGHANRLERGPQTGPELTVALTVLETLPMRLQRGCVRRHGNSFLLKLLILSHVRGRPGGSGD